MGDEPINPDLVGCGVAAGLGPHDRYGRGQRLRKREVNPLLGRDHNGVVRREVDDRGRLLAVEGAPDDELTPRHGVPAGGGRAHDEPALRDAR